MTTIQEQDAPHGYRAAGARRNELRPRVRELREQGQSYNAISKELGIGWQTARRIAEERDGEKYTPPLAEGFHAKHSQIVELAKEGHSVRRIAKSLSISSKTVILSLRREGYAKSPTPKVDRVELARAKAFLDDRTGYSEASRSTGIPIETLKLHFPGMGLTRHEVGLLGWPLRRITNRAAANGIDLVPLARIRGA